MLFIVDRCLADGTMRELNLAELLGSAKLPFFYRLPPA